MQSVECIRKKNSKNELQRKKVQQLPSDVNLKSHKEGRMDDSDIDIIDCSISGAENSKKINSKKICKPKIKKFKSQEKIIVKTPNNIRCSNISNCIWLKNNTLNANENHILKTEGAFKKKVDSFFSHSEISEKESVVIPLSKTPEKTYLSKTKLKNIQHWLQSNDFQCFQTPPFANLSITPVKFNNDQEILERERNFENESSSLDSDVEGVLKAVYGDEWMQKYSSKKSKTEPKKCFNPKILTLTEVKGKRIASTKSARRNILTNYHKSITNPVDNFQSVFNESIASGFKLINYNESNESLNSITADSPLHPIQKNHFKEKNFQKKINLPSLNKNFENEKIFLNCKIESVRPNKSQLKRCQNAITSPQKTFLESLSVSTPTSRCHPDAQFYKHNFNSKKDQLIKVLYKLFNNEVFEEKLPPDMNFSWNVKLRGTAGYCYNKRITKSTGNIIRISRIEFSSKIVDRADRLRDTMIHELCHAASWVIEGKLDGHGPVWNTWAAKAMNRFPELPLIKRCHNYDIVSKYVYKCTSCGYSIKRHSKSLDTEKKRCGHCFGVFKLYFNKRRKGAAEIPEFNATTTLPTPNKFALFVKDNYHIVRSATKNPKHAEIMKILSEQYSSTKNKISSVK